MRKITFKPFLVIALFLLIFSSCQKDDPKPAEIISIVIKTEPTKTEYYVGENLDLTGIVITLNKDNGETEDIPFSLFDSKGITCIPNNGIELIVNTNIIITHTKSGKNISQTITVNEIVLESIEIKTPPTKVNYYLGEKLDLSGLAITLTMNNSTTEDVFFHDFADKGITCTPENDTTLRTQSTEITILHNETGEKTVQPITFIKLTDIDENIYPLVKIGNQIWMAKNLRTTHYADGTKITLVESREDWIKLSINDKAYSYYDNSNYNAESNGALYTWAAAMNGESGSNTNPSNVQGACPDGWHIPSEVEWTELINYLNNNGHSGSVAIVLKSTNEWINDGNGTDYFGFNLLPAGYREAGYFINYGQRSYIWSATEWTSDIAYHRYFDYSFDNIGTGVRNKVYGMSVRCLQD